MSTKAKVGIGIVVLLVIGMVFGESDEPTVTAPPAPPVVEEPAPAPEPEPEDKEPFAYGDDEELDGLWDACEAGDEEACDDLYWLSPIGSEYETYALDRVNELAGVEAPSAQDLTDMLGAEFFLEQVWAGMNLDERAEICLGVGLFGAEGAATIIVAEAPSFDVREVAEWLAKTCA